VPLEWVFAGCRRITAYSDVTELEDPIVSPPWFPVPLDEPGSEDFNPGPNAVFLTPAHDSLVLPGEGLQQLIRANRLHEISCPQPEYPSAAKVATFMARSRYAR